MPYTPSQLKQQYILKTGNKVYDKRSKIWKSLPQQEKDIYNTNIRNIKTIINYNDNIINGLNKFIRDNNNITQIVNYRIDTNELTRYSNLNFIISILIKNIKDNFTSPNGLISIGIGDYNFGLSQNSMNNLINNINLNFLNETTDHFGSDTELINNLNMYNYFNITIRPKTNINVRNEGAFFPYYNISNIDLTPLQIFNFNNSNNEDNCLLYAFKQLGMLDKYIEIIKTFINNRLVPVSSFKEICNLLDICINLHTKRNDDNTHKIKITTYGNKNKKTYNICLLENHYFALIDLPYTSYSIINYQEIKNINGFNRIFNHNGKRFLFTNNRYINSFDILNLMLNNKEQFFTKINADNIVEKDELYFKNLKNISFNSLEYSDINIKEVINDIDDKEKKEFKIVFFDFETYKDNNNNNIPYLCCSIDSNNNKNHFYGVNAGFKLLNSLKEDTLLIAHNAKFDYNFIVKYLYNCSEIKNGSNFITFYGRFKNINIRIKDSYKLIPSPLKDFPEMFNLTNIKEVMPYNLYTEDTINKRFIDFNEVISFIKKDDINQFNSNLKKWDCLNNDKVDIIKYSREYCIIDCILLKEGFNIFREWCLNDFKLDINDILTIPSLAHQYLLNQGCYKGCYELSGIPRMFISKCIVGGRVMSSNNKKIKLINRFINDFDAVSLYPSAMFRMDGFLKGVPKILNTTDYNIIKNYDGYFLQIKIKSISIKRNFPLLSIRDINNNTRNFTNDIIGEIVFIDKIALEDLIKYQGVEFEVINGYYFDEGFNNKINEVIKDLFDKRKELKKNDNKSELIYKLIMNASYGKLITKPHEKDIKFFNNDKDFNKYYSINYNKINNYINYSGDKYKLEEYIPLNNQFNMAHLGVSILSMSKRIMNEVICTAEDNNLNIYYQDTDSIHIEDDDIDKLQHIYKNNFNRELIGEDLGQFHSDFKLKGATKNIKAVKSIFLGKKSYIDELKGEDDEGNIIKGFHIRMKSIGKKVINYHAKKFYDGDVFKLFDDLYNGVKITFDLTNEGENVNFKFNKDYTVSTQNIFNREISF